MWTLIASGLRFIIPLATIGVGIFLGLKLEPDKDLADRTLLMFGVGLSTFSPLGLILYFKFWETKPEFSATCGKQAIIGLLCFISLALINYLIPPAIIRW